MHNAYNNIYTYILQMRNGFLSIALKKKTFKITRTHFAYITNNYAKLIRITCDIT